MAEAMRLEYKGSTIIIMDDCVVKTQEEVDEILARCSEIWRRDLVEKEIRRRRAEKE